MNNLNLPNLWIAIPDSSLSDEQTKRDKTIKISQFARACSMFRVKKIYVYHDKTTNTYTEDFSLLKTVLRYLDTPQYLRKLLYPLSNELEYAGLLHPINAPHHRGLERIKDVKFGDVRVGVILKVRGKLHADVGLSSLIGYEGSGFHRQKVNVKIVSTHPPLKGREATDYDIKDDYWGYEVHETCSLNKLLDSTTNTQIIITSKKGQYVKDKEAKILARLKSIRNLLLVFGTPKKGVDEILAAEGRSTDEYEFVLNMFPYQGTRTVRLEEAVLGSLAIFNHFLSK
ncbi:MAG TPA: RNA methyltransferase [Candidatus Nitrosopolaris sp.]|nr:RNA methyltransferase [Candidatus Nitrosopolaris sp.]